MVSKTFGCAVFGVDAKKITVEVNVGGGRKFWMSGLPDNAVKESQHRVESSLKSIGCEMPRNKVVVNLAPADIKKEGSAYDLSIALAILKSSGQVHFDSLENFVIMGELALDGALRKIRGVLPIAIEARKNNFKGIILPKVNAREASIVNDIDVIGVDSLAQAVEFLTGKREIEPLVTDTRDVFNYEQDKYDSDFGDVQGQENIKRSLEIAASGGHNVILLCTLFTYVNFWYFYPVP